MYYEQRKPDFTVSIVRPKYSTPGAYLEETIETLSSNENNEKLVGYNYQLNIESLSCPFSLTFVPYVVNEKGETMIDILRPLDLVKIEEHGETKYLGVIDSIRYSARMTDSGPRRSIVAQGYGVAGVIEQFIMLLDSVILSDANTTIESLKAQVAPLIADLSAQYGANTSMFQVFDQIRKSFKTVMEQIGGYTPGTGIFKIVDQYLQFSDESKLFQTKYPLALSIFNYGGISLGQIWQELVYKPFYEFFARWDEPANKWLLSLRPTPFEPDAWLGLRRTVVDPLYVDAFDCGFSTKDVKTWFFAYLAGGSISYDQARAMYQKTAIKKDPAKWALYGYRPLECAFKYVNMDKIVADGHNIMLATSQPSDPNAQPETISDEKLMDEYSTKIAKWYERADEMLTGSIDVMTMKNGPRLGERAVFNDVEFYVESIAGSWEYGDKMLTRLSVTRGGVYNQGYAADKSWWFRRAPRLGDRLELKREKAQL